GLKWCPNMKTHRLVAVLALACSAFVASTLIACSGSNGSPVLDKSPADDKSDTSETTPAKKSADSSSAGSATTTSSSKTTTKSPDLATTCGKKAFGAACYACCDPTGAFDTYAQAFASCDANGDGSCQSDLDAQCAKSADCSAARKCADSAGCGDKPE